KYTELRREQARARAAGRYFGIGLALAVDPSVSNMGYVATALDPQFRAKPEYLPKSGAMDSATVKIDPLGRVIAILGTTPQGQGHQTIVSQIVASELGVEPRDVTVVDEMDTFTRVWSISSGTYSSRCGSVGHGRVRLHGGQGRGRRGPRELLQHVRFHRRGDGRGGGPRHGGHHDREVRHRARCGHDHQPDDRRGADLRRRAPRPGRRALRGARL